MKKLILTTTTVLFILGGLTPALALTPLEQLGKQLFFDANLSTPPGMSCAFCHAPETGWTGPNSAINAAGAVMPGVIHTRAGNRKPPTVAYAGETPQLALQENLFKGGVFWDGRATGWELGDPLQEQALGPFLNPVEMKNPNEKVVLIEAILKSKYADLFKEVYFDVTGNRVPRAPGKFELTALYQFIGKAIAAYERSDEVNPFNSKFDVFWKNAREANLLVENINESNWGLYKNKGLNDMELFGLAVFNGQGKCSACHVLTPSGTAANPKPPLFTDFSYDNLGIPKNPLNPFYFQTKKINPLGEAWIDLGLGDFLAKTSLYADKATENYGKHRVPSLRNVDKRPYPEFVKAYGHNGYFKSLRHIVHFYNTRDVPGQGWPPPGMGMGETVPWPPAEYPETVNKTELGDLGLVPATGMPILEFLKTLSDTSTPTAP